MAPPPASPSPMESRTVGFYGRRRASALIVLLALSSKHSDAFTPSSISAVRSIARATAAASPRGTASVRSTSSSSPSSSSRRPAFFLGMGVPPASPSPMESRTVGFYGRRRASALIVLLALSSKHADAFTPTSISAVRSIAPTASPRGTGSVRRSPSSRRPAFFLGMGVDFDAFPKNDDDEEDEDEEDEDDEEDDEVDPYLEKAASEFSDSRGSSSSSSSSSLVSAANNPPVGTTSVDWGGAYGSLSNRITDARSGASSDPAHALFRIMSADAPNKSIGRFVAEADPEVVTAMSGAVGSLLGGLSNPETGVETIVKATKEKLGNLCFQLQMTGYMFRNAEYVLALKDLMDIRVTGATLADYRDAFDRIDIDGSGYIEAKEIEALLADVYGGETPVFEVDAFLNFFDTNNDGRVSWEEFEKGLGAVYA
eukprot:CAMPEP_0183328362 /NCGR_PEP_ID=MMETSP0160_2-20130417/84241_1 /TAXON_ID=2839 ORGANISM="Odontella Sinensis, Strain Grunow 1884" /NCGR_SAMPLE_ID=MMETSP0160_2 /ASSEMBLY_ACC=CAM_ASM_000250 /LENGTH=426 /DNA_ID=CAMNT_0025496521 /DNA_START=46 /DNA_END=1323 /DNA_ORIENTATION=-